MIIGYARVSTTDQDLSIQKEALLKNGAKYIYEEKKSGKDLSRLALQDCLENLQAHDTLLVTKLDRLSRSTSDTIKLLDTLSKNQIYIKSINDGIDTSTPSGKMFAQFLAIMAEHERTCILERTAAGREKAKREGKLTGRPLKHSHERIKLVMEDIMSGLDLRESCKFRGVSVPTFYRRIKKLQEASKKENVNKTVQSEWAKKPSEISLGHEMLLIEDKTPQTVETTPVATPKEVTVLLPEPVKKEPENQ